jgi:hypothetical protein
MKAWILSNNADGILRKFWIHVGIEFWGSFCLQMLGLGPSQ